MPPSSDSVIKGLSLYLNKKRYNQAFGDAAPLIISNALRVELSILNETQHGIVEDISVLPTRETPSSHIYVHRERDHYNGLVPKVPSSGQSQTNCAKQSYVYNSQELRNMCGNYALDRTIRKKLFKLKLWHPKGNVTDTGLPNRIAKGSPVDSCSRNKRLGVCHSNLISIKLEAFASKHSKKPFCLGIVNARSIKEKTDELKEYMVQHDIDTLAVTESWLTPSDSKARGDLEENGYSLQDIPREDRTGGGVATLSKSNICVRKLPYKRMRSFEYMENIVTINSASVRLLIVYRPEVDAKKKKIPVSLFFSEFSKIMDVVSVAPMEILITGDFNFHMNKNDDPEACQFKEFLTTYDVMNHVVKPTCRSGNTLDLVITRRGSKFLLDHSVDYEVSDHNIIRCYLDMDKPPLQKEVITFRRYKSIDKAKFSHDLQTRLSSVSQLKDINSMVDAYNSSLKDILDTHAPVQRKVVLIRHKTPWMSENILKEKRVRRSLERKWRENKTVENRQNLKAQRNIVVALNNDARTQYLSSMVEENKDNPKRLFGVINTLLHRKKKSPLPNHDSEKGLADDFIDFFSSKIQKIRDQLDIQTVPYSCSFPDEKCGVEFTEFKPLSEADIRKIILQSSNSSCELDPVPVWLLKDYLDHILPIITSIVNSSYDLAVMPEKLKYAILRPLLKKIGLELILNHFRPVSNLSFLSKVVEKGAAIQLKDYMLENGLYEYFQSAYKQFHSTETALVRVQNDLLLAKDKQLVSLLILLDLSAAFDTIDHQILCQRLETRFGIKDKALDWIKSYISGRTQSVKIGEEYSKCVPLKYGVPQGSVLGPILFSAYSSPLGDIARKHRLDYHLFADDTQLYLSFKANELSKALDCTSKVQVCLEEIRCWMVTNKTSRPVGQVSPQEPKQSFI